MYKKKILPVETKKAIIRKGLERRGFTVIKIDCRSSIILFEADGNRYISYFNRKASEVALEAHTRRDLEYMADVVK